MHLKVCTECEIEKSQNEFHKATKGKDGLAAKCKICFKKYYILNKEKLKNISSERYKQNKEFLNAKRREKYRENKNSLDYVSVYSLSDKEKYKQRRKIYAEKNTEKIRLQKINWLAKPGNILKNQIVTRINYLKKKYNLTIEMYNEMLTAQEGSCAICNEIPDNTGINSLVIDHVHESNPVIVRGLLCNFCNMALGYIKDDYKCIEKIINYLNKPATNIKFTNNKSFFYVYREKKNNCLKQFVRSVRINR